MIDEETQGRIQSFVKSLTKAGDTEIQHYVSEILSDKEFIDSIARKGDDGSGKKPFSLKVLAIDPTSGIALYTLCRTLNPAVVVETGVASGISSAYILRALDKNNHGKLFSIDVPWHTVTQLWKARFTDVDTNVRPMEKQSGWIIPDYLRGRWELLLGKSSEKLPLLLREVGPVDVFFHDSEHTYETMSWEFRTVWPNLRTGGMLLAHNATGGNNAFSDFERSVGGESFRLLGMNNELGRVMTTGAKIKA